MKLAVLAFAAVAWAAAAAVGAEASDRTPAKREEKVPLPEILNMDSFDKALGQQLSFVEFFSPMCSHCKALAPKWEKTYQKYRKEMEKLNVQMRQVDCIASGDLCEREEVSSYPNLRIYAPVIDKDTGAPTGKAKFVTQYPRSLGRTPENFFKFMKNAIAEYASGTVDLPSASKLLSVDRALDLIAGKATVPEFVIFHPGTTEEWENSEKSGKNEFSRPCRTCMDNKRLWDKLSNQILSTVSTNHFGCVDNPELCQQLGFKTLTKEGAGTPALVMFLPKAVGVIRIDYTGKWDFDEIKRFALRLYENQQYSTLSPLALSDVMDVRKTLPFQPAELYYPPVNKIAIMLFYDAKTVTEEDKAILPHILEHISNSPFNVYLYTAKSDKYEGVINSQADNMMEYISYDKDQPLRKFNKPLYLATTLTSKPTILIFKDNCLITPVYQSFSPGDIRSKDRVLEFIDKHLYPLTQELTPALVKTYFSGDASEVDNEKVVVTFIDSEKAKQKDVSFYNMSLAVHEYHYLKQEYFFNRVLKQRQLKQEKAEALRHQNADSVKVIKALRKDVPHLYDTNQVLFTYVDLSQDPEFANRLGWNINGQGYKPGDAIVVTKDGKYYWDQDVNGQPLKNDPSKLTQTLMYLLDPQSTGVSGDVRIKRKLVGSPYSRSLRFMDDFHERGIPGYLLLVCFFYGIFSTVRSLWKHRAHGTKGAIIGAMSKDD